MNPQHAKILRAYGGWVLADIVLTPDTAISHAVSSASGCSHYAGESWYMQTTPKGIEVREGFTEPLFDVVTWTAVRRWVRELTLEQVQAVADARSAISKHMTTHRLHPNGTHMPYRQPRPFGPVTLEQIAYDQACAEWEIWRASYDTERRVLEAARERALDGCFTTEPADLLELIEAGA